jgi:SEN1 N terminal
VNVIRAFSQLIACCGKSLWSNEADSPLQAFNSIRDNHFLEKHILSLKGTEELGKLFDWIESFANSTWTHSAFSEVLSTLAQYFAENLQHERFGPFRTKAMEIILSVCVILAPPHVVL